MCRPRVIPCLLLRNQGLVKTTKFKAPKYLGDPINVVRIFNDKEVDELVFLDITATVEHKRPPFELLEKVAGEAFMPLSYGGGIRDLHDIKIILGLGVEKVIINTYAVENPSFISQAADLVGSQSIVISIDARKNIWGSYQVFTHSGTTPSRLDPVKMALESEKLGAGEILLNSIDRDGTMKGYDVELVRRVTARVNIPVVACGGARTIEDLQSVIEAGASAAAAGSMFVFQGPHRAVLISYPAPQALQAVFKN